MSSRAMFAVTLGTILCAALIAGCKEKKNESSSASHKSMTDASLYTRLGGEKSIAAVCDEFVTIAAADPKVNFFRKDIPGVSEWKPSAEELATFKKHFVQFVCVAAGGPQKYQGRDMKSVHKGMKITDAQFNAAAADLALALDKFNVPAREKTELLNAVAATKPDIVEN